MRSDLRILCLIVLLLALLPFAPARAAEPPPAPILLAPADGTTTTAANAPPLGIPEFSWERVTITSTYRIQFSQDIAFTTKIEVTTANPSYTPTDATKFPDGAWYWRVRVETPAPASEYSEIRSFTKQWASADNAPLLSSPADGATVAFYDAPVFSWLPVTGAASYRFQIAASADGFDAPRYNQITLAPAHQPTAKLTNGAYYWRVIPLDAAGREGLPGEVRAFTATYNLLPQLLEPADGATPAFTPAFRWTAVRGAQYYRLQYATDPSFNAGVTQVDTRNTTYTPLNDLPNDVNYYWRVRVQSGSAVADWSETRSFVKRWYNQAQLLTPTNNYGNIRLPPLFSWTPVAGASYYKIEVNNANSFPPGVQGWTATTANPFWVQPEFDKLPSYTNWYWRATPYDRNLNAGRPSDVFSFRYNGSALAPNPVYPLYYYPPSPLLQPHEDRTAAWSIFTWQRIVYSQTQIAAYRVQVDDDPLFGSVEWSADTQNLSAVPTADNPFAPVVGRDYYWRVRPLDGLAGNEIGQWSQTWRARFDPSVSAVIARSFLSEARSRLAGAVEGGDEAIPSDGGDCFGAAAPRNDDASAPTLLRPPHASEAVETSPLLEWRLLSGADSYDVQISSAPDFNPAYLVRAATVPFPAYAPPSRLPYGTYYWRVLGRRGGVPVGSWSAVWRFQVAAGSHWQEPRTLGSAANRQMIGFDPYGDMLDANYDVATLYAVQSKDYWFFGFNATTGATDMVYMLYLDLDHADDSGATADPRGYAVTTIAAHRPEYAIYVPQAASAFDASQVAIYRWSGDAWATPQLLDEVGGALTYDLPGRYLELRVPNTAIGMQETTGSAAVSLFSVMSGGGHAQDTVPADPNVAYVLPDAVGETSTLSRFTSVSERIAPALPPTNATGDPTTYPTLPAFAWHLPLDVPWYGFNLQAATDPAFTSSVLNYTIKYNLASYAPVLYTYSKDLNGDNTYYWRVRPVYDSSGNWRGAWSAAGAFDRTGFVPQELRASVAIATPTFAWGMVEGAESYDVQVDDDPNFGTPTVAGTTSRNSFSPTPTLAQGAYYWRVRARRYGNLVNDWTPAQVFTATLPLPAGLTHDPAGAPLRAPTLCWTPTIATADGAAVFAAWKHRVQVSRDPTFSQLTDNIDTEQACWTPIKGYADGTHYWRVAAIDGDTKAGSFSPAAEFTKQYPVTTLIAPSGGSSGATPTFVWTPVVGAASYKLEVSLNATFSPLYDSVTTANVRYTPTKKYDQQKVYYWRVAMVDKDRNQGPFTGDQVIVRELRRFLPWMGR